MFGVVKDSAKNAWCVFTEPYNEDGPNARLFFFKKEDGSISISGSASKEVTHLLKGMMVRGMLMNE